MTGERNFDLSRFTDNELDTLSKESLKIGDDEFTQAIAGEIEKRRLENFRQKRPELLATIYGQILAWRNERLGKKP